MSEDSGHKKRAQSRGRKPGANRNSKRSPSKSSNKAKNFNSSGSGRNRRPKSLTPNRVVQKYENLMEQHVIARKKYFEMHGRVSGKQLEKIEKNFNRTLLAIFEFKDSLKPWQKDVLDNKFNLYPEDRQYSRTHDLAPSGEPVDFQGKFEDPHLLESQKNHQWTSDTEESQGTIDDYNKYKGIIAEN